MMQLRHFPERELTLSPTEFVPTEGSGLSVDEQRDAWVRRRALEAGFRLAEDEANGWQLAEPGEVIEHVDGFVTLRQWINPPSLHLIAMLNSRPEPRPETSQEPAPIPAEIEPGPAWLHLVGGGRVLLDATSPARTPAARRSTGGEPAFLTEGAPVVERDRNGWRLVVRLTPLAAPGPTAV